MAKTTSIKRELISEGSLFRYFILYFLVNLEIKGCNIIKAKERKAIPVDVELKRAKKVYLDENKFIIKEEEIIQIEYT